MLEPSDDVDERKPKVFLSSTVKDLVKHRAAAIETLTRLGCEVLSFANEPASGEHREFKRSQRAIADCDLFIVIIGSRYGFVPPDNNLGQRSIVELEIELAQRLKKPMLAYVSDREHLEHDDSDEKHLAELRRAIMERVIVRRFSSVEALVESIRLGVLRWMEEAREGRAQGAWGEVSDSDVRPSIPPDIDPFELAWRLVVERVAEPTLLRHMDLDHVREAVTKWSAQTSRNDAELATIGRLDFARQCANAIAQLRSKQHDSPNALWLAWMRATRAHLLTATATGTSGARPRSHDEPPQS